MAELKRGEKFDGSRSGSQGVGTSPLRGRQRGSLGYPSAARRREVYNCLRMGPGPGHRVYCGEARPGRAGQGAKGIPAYSGMLNKELSRGRESAQIKHTRIQHMAIPSWTHLQIL